MKNKLLVQSRKSLKWGIWYRNAGMIPSVILFAARAIYNCDTKELIVSRLDGGTLEIPQDIDSLPVASNITCGPAGMKLIRGIVFGFDYVGMWDNQIPHDPSETANLNLV